MTFLQQYNIESFDGVGKKSCMYYGKMTSFQQYNIESFEGVGRKSLMILYTDEN